MTLDKNHAHLARPANENANAERLKRLVAQARRIVDMFVGDGPPGELEWRKAQLAHLLRDLDVQATTPAKASRVTSQ